MGEHLILDDGRVLVDEYILYGEGGDFREQNTAEGVGDRGINAGERELGVVWIVAVEDDVEVLAPS